MSDTPPRTYPVYQFRVAQKSGGVPFPVTLSLPVPDKPVALKDRKANTVYAEDFLPQTPDHHMVLGQFVDSWGYLENIVSHLLKVLLAPESQSGTVSAVFRNIGMKQAMNILQSLATLKLGDDEIAELVNLLERLSKINSKRNKLVHGHWSLEVIIYVTRNEDVAFKGTLLREINPADHRMVSRISDLRNQRERIDHTFNLRRIIAATRDARTLAKDIVTYREKISPLLNNPVVDDPNNNLTDQEKGLV